MVHISDHAVLRYLERVHHLDIEAIRDEMRCPALDTASRIGCNTVILGNGARLRLKGQHVVTVVPKRGS